MCNIFAIIMGGNKYVSKDCTRLHAFLHFLSNLMIFQIAAAIFFRPSKLCGLTAGLHVVMGLGRYPKSGEKLMYSCIQKSKEIPHILYPNQTLATQSPRHITTCNRHYYPITSRR